MLLCQSCLCSTYRGGSAGAPEQSLRRGDLDRLRSCALCSWPPPLATGWGMDADRPPPGSHRTNVGTIVGFAQGLQRATSGFFLSGRQRALAVARAGQWLEMWTLKPRQGATPRQTSEGEGDGGPGGGMDNTAKLARVGRVQFGKRILELLPIRGSRDGECGTALVPYRRGQTSLRVPPLTRRAAWPHAQARRGTICW
jgi:hypothetical protein